MFWIFAFLVFFGGFLIAFNSEYFLSKAVEQGSREAGNLISLSKLGSKVLLALSVLSLGFSSVYILPPEEQGLVYTFGQYTKIVDQGIHFRVPFVQTVESYITTKIYRQEIGFRTVSQNQYQEVSQESKMFTKDENIINVEAVLLYRIADLKKFAINIDSKDAMILNAGQAALRQVVGTNTLEDLLTIGKDRAQMEAKDIVQEIFDKYDSGLLVSSVQLQDVNPPTPVVGAFKDVASAREDKIRQENEAMGYANSVLPQARGEAQQKVNEALAYKEKRIKEAEGDVAKFNAIYEKYKTAKDVTKTRLYLEAMETILPRTKKIIIDESVKSQIIIGNSGIVPIKTPETAGGN